MAISVTPVHSLTLRTFFHVFPPLSVLYNPLSPPEDQRGPCEATNTISGSFGLTIILDMCSEDFNPIDFQLFPPLSLTKTPCPIPTCLPPTFSPVPSHIFDELWGSMVIQPVE